MSLNTLPLSQIAISSIDLRQSETWWREGLGFLPSATTRLFRGKGLSGVTGIANAAATTRWLVGQDEWLQIELWQYENPVPRLKEPDYAPNHIGFSRCGVWVKDFDDALIRLSNLGSQPLSASIGKLGERRVCVRDPDGIYVELFEQDPLEGLVPEGKYPSNAALRSITLCTPDLASSVQFAKQGLGLKQFKTALHTDEHEQLWGFNQVNCERANFISQAMIVEWVQYRSPMAKPRHPHSRLNDQGILNVAFGDNQSIKGIETMCIQTSQAGAVPGNWMRTPLGGCVYMTDPQGFSFEFMWSRPGLGHKLTGYLPIKKTKYIPADNRCVKNQLLINAKPETVFALLADHEGMSEWAGFGKIEMIHDGFHHDNGLGAKRLAHALPFRVTEEITQWEPNKKIHYRILHGGPFNNYTGEITLEATNEGTRIIWVNRFRAKIPGTGYILSFVINQKIRASLKALKCKFEAS